MPNLSSPRVIVIGGSLAGLLAANLLHRRGWQVDVFERTDGVLEGRGAGITILPGLIEAFRAAGVEEQTIGIELPGRIALDRNGNVVARRDYSQVMTSWRRLYDLLKAAFPTHLYHAGQTLERIEQDAETVRAFFTDGTVVEGALLIGADGIRSTVRAQLLPQASPTYSGYIAWRCLADESVLSAEAHRLLLANYTVCVAPGEQGIGYAVPGPGHRMTPGKRQYNVVWYHPVEEHRDLPALMTDDTGRYHPNGIPPGLIRAEVRDQMTALAHEVLAPQFAEAIRGARLIFFQPIIDFESPKLVFGRVIIIGDAAFVARPHVAMGVPKAGGDALALVEALTSAAPGDLSGLAAFEAERIRVGRAIVARGRYLGAYMEAQSKSDGERRKAEALRIPEQVMMETAFPVDYDAAG
jgi:2-polyprenyl-6-methoxyphenol hydroxylase-like FAD-dependent oxidoreductase